MRLPVPRRRRGPLQMRASLWYPEPATARELARERCRPEAVGGMVDLDVPVRGTLAVERSERGDESTFWVDGQALVPVVSATGALFLSWAASPDLLNRPVGGGAPLTCWLVLDPGVPEAVRDRLTAAGWRLGRPRPGGGRL